MKNIIILEKIKQREKLFKSIADITKLAEIARASNLDDLVLKYKGIMNNANLNIAKEQKLTRVNKY